MNKYIKLANKLLLFYDENEKRMTNSQLRTVRWLARNINKKINSQSGGGGAADEIDKAIDKLGNIQGQLVIIGDIDTYELESKKMRRMVEEKLNTCVSDSRVSEKNLNECRAQRLSEKNNNKGYSELKRTNANIINQIKEIADKITAAGDSHVKDVDGMIQHISTYIENRQEDQVRLNEDVSRCRKRETEIE